MTSAAVHLCPHCQQPTRRWTAPTPSCWPGTHQQVCFNDECPYYVRGWTWMEGQFGVQASYRYRFDPTTGESGPLPVWSRDALRGNIVPDEDTSDGR